MTAARHALVSVALPPHGGEGRIGLPAVEAADRSHRSAMARAQTWFLRHPDAREGSR